MDSSNALTKLEWPDVKYMPPAMRDFKAKFDAAMEEHVARSKLVDTSDTQIRNAEVDAAQIAAGEQKRLRAIREIAAEIKYLTLGKCERRFERITAAVEKIRELVK